jgi:site-specific recombinase XerD
VIIYHKFFANYYIYVSDVFTEFARHVEVPQVEELQVLAAEVPNILEQARAATTNNSYGLAFNRWKVWASQFPGFGVLPAEPAHVVLFLTHLARTAKSYSTINVMISAIAWAHSMAGLPSPSHSILVSEVLQGLKRSLAKPTIRKEPLELSHIRKIAESIDFASISDVRNSVLIIVAYYAMLRVDELRHIKLSHLKFEASHL